MHCLREIIVHVCFAFFQKGLQHFGIDKLEILDLSSNSTNFNFVYGIAANAVAVLLYGSMSVPVKKIETGDGKHRKDLNIPG